MVIDPEPIPLAIDSDGVARVGGTRVTLDSVIAAFNEGMTAEGIVEQYPSLQLANVYAVLGYYLNHRAEIEAYLQARIDLVGAVQVANERRWSPREIRERLLARRK